jgi:hypothetical protein
MERSVGRLGDLEAIRTLKARYCRFLDAKRWEALRALFAPDARFEGFASAPDGADADAFVRGVAARLGDAITMHHCHTPDIAFVDDDTARGIWSMEDYLEWPAPAGLPGAPRSRGLWGCGFYEEQYRRLDGAWKMQRLRLVRVRAVALPDDHPPPRLAPATPTVGWLDGA